VSATVATKLCECGCGNPAPIARASSPKWGTVKGQPQRFVRGHSPRRPVAYRFWAKVQKTDACWEWTSTRCRGGYGMLQVDGRGQLAHRVSYEILVGPIPDGSVVRHREARNRTAVGERNGKSKLSDEDVWEILRLNALGLKYGQIAERFPVHPHTISEVCRGIARPHLREAQQVMDFIREKGPMPEKKAPDPKPTPAAERRSR
jgi:hypothetical protein